MDQASYPVKECSCILLWILAWLYAECCHDCCSISLHIFHQGVKSSWCLELLRCFSKPLLISAWEHCAVIALGLIEDCMLLDCEFPFNPGDSYSLFEDQDRGKGRRMWESFLKGIHDEPLPINTWVFEVSECGFLCKLTDVLTLKPLCSFPSRF